MITHIDDFLEESVKKFPDKTAFFDPFSQDLKSISYKEFELLSQKVASKISEFGFYQSPVLILLPKGINALVAFFWGCKKWKFLYLT